MEFEKLVKLARHCSAKDACIKCSVGGCSGPTGLMSRLADAVEELTASVECYEDTTDMAFVEEDGGTMIRFLPKWIPVTEKPPKAYEEVLLLFPHNQAAGFCDRDGCWSVYSGDGFYTEVADNEPKPTHWARKLPEPQKEEEANV